MLQAPIHSHINKWATPFWTKYTNLICAVKQHQEFPLYFQLSAICQHRQFEKKGEGIVIGETITQVLENTDIQAILRMTPEE